MIILSIVCILLAGTLLLVMDKLARTQPGGSQSGLERREGTGPQPVSSRRPFPYDHESYPGSV